MTAMFTVLTSEDDEPKLSESIEAGGGEVTHREEHRFGGSVVMAIWALGPAIHVMSKLSVAGQYSKLIFTGWHNGDEGEKATAFAQSHIFQQALVDPESLPDPDNLRPNLLPLVKDPEDVGAKKQWDGYARVDRNARELLGI